MPVHIWHVMNYCVAQQFWYDEALAIKWSKTNKIQEGMHVIVGTEIQRNKQNLGHRAPNIKMLLSSPIHPNEKCIMHYFMSHHKN